MAPLGRAERNPIFPVLHGPHPLEGTSNVATSTTIFRRLVLGVFGALPLTLPLAPALAAEKGEVTMETVAYKGWEHNVRLTNGDVELIVTLDVGPRIISYRLADGPNVFKEYAEQLGKAGEAEWMIRGGHRLWTSPEDLTRTYATDNAPASFRKTDQGAALIRGADDSRHGVRKEVELRLAPSGSQVTLIHRIHNIGREPTELAPWALSVMAPGGVEILPMPPRRPHPGSPKNARSPADFAADRVFVLWPYFDFTDPRWTFGSRYITLRQDPTRGPTKIGTANREGWVAYLNGGTLFVKRFDFHKEASYPDGGCNYETFTNEDMLEMESLGPLVRLEPGKAVEHTERWELIPGQGTIKDEADIARRIVPLIEGR
jgi:hypothetical protein